MKTSNTEDNSVYFKLDHLPYKVIRQKDDNFYKLADPTKLRRNWPWKTDVIVQQRTLFDLNEMCLLSRIHLKPSNLMKIKIEIATEIKGPYIVIEKDLELTAGKLRVVKIGSLPCRYFRITTLKGCPFSEYSSIKCYGMQVNGVKDKYDEETLDILYYNSYDLLYN